MNNIQALLKNPHMLWCVCVIGALQIAAVWLPQFQAQLDHTRQIVMLYALAVAANTPNQPAPAATQAPGDVAAPKLYSPIGDHHD